MTDMTNNVYSEAFGDLKAATAYKEVTKTHAKLIQSFGPDKYGGDKM